MFDNGNVNTTQLPVFSSVPIQGDSELWCNAQGGCRGDNLEQKI